jgi:hypothetical protein
LLILSLDYEFIGFRWIDVLEALGLACFYYTERKEVLEHKEKSATIE